MIGVFHDINLALRLTDNVVFVKEGHIVRSGVFDQIADTQFLNDIYETNIAAYMMDSLEKWRKIR